MSDIPEPILTEGRTLEAIREDILCLKLQGVGEQDLRLHAGTLNDLDLAPGARLFGVRVV